MKSLSETAYLEIKVDEWKTAQCKVEGINVRLSWGDDIDEPTVAALVASLPPDPDFVPITLAGGRIEWAPAGWKGLRLGKGSPILEAAKLNYDFWAGKGPLSPGARAARSAERFTDMIRPFVPDFDNYDKRQQTDYIIRTQEKIAAVRESVEDLVKHLKYATPDKYKAVPPLKEPVLKVRAAVFSDMLKSTRQAAEILGVPSTKTDKIKHENGRVKTRAKLGRALLHDFYGKSEYEVMIGRMQQYHRWWKWFDSIDDPRKQMYVLLAEVEGTSTEYEVLRATEDGFADKLEEWVGVVERRLSFSESSKQSDSPTETENARQLENQLWHRQKGIEQTDARFEKALSLASLEVPPPSIA